MSIRRFFHFLFFASFFTSSVLLSAQEPVNYESQIVSSIATQWMNADSSSVQNPQAVLSRMSTKEGEVFSQVKFDQDLKMLSYDFDRIEPIVTSQGEQIQIQLRIWLKPMIRSIRFEGNPSIARTTLLKELGITPLTVFDRAAFNKSFHKLKAFYIKKGFFEAELSYNLERDPTTQEIDIIIQVHEGRSGRIREMVFEGFTEQEKNEIIERISTRLYNVFRSWFTQEGTYNEEMIRQDEYRIADYLQNLGYADAIVKIRIEEIGRDALALIIHADRGSQYTFGTISFSGHSVLSDSLICRVMTIKEGQPFSMDKLRQTIENITALYGRRGYIDALVNFDLHLVAETNAYNVQLTIEEDRQYRVGLIKIFGNNHTQARVILHESLLVPGQVFDAEKLKNTELRLLNTDYFKNVNVYPVKSAEFAYLGPEYRDIHIEVEEKGTGAFNITFGVSTTEGLFGSVELKERNFNIRGLRNLPRYGFRSLRGAGEYLHLNSTIGTKTTSYTLSWVKPHICETPWTVGFDLAQITNRYVSSDYQLRSLSSNVHANYDINLFMKWGTHYRLKYTYTKQTGEPEKKHKDDDQEQLSAPEDEQEKNKGESQYEKETNLHGVISAVGAHWTYNSTNHPLFPTKGFFSRLDGEFAGLGGRFKFLYFSYLNTLYVPVKQYGYFRFRADFKFVCPIFGKNFASIPMDERLFLGDDTFVRGYRPYKLGPTFKDKPNAPRGGASLEYFSAQYSHYLFSNVEAFAFVDGGGLTDVPLQFFPEVFLSAGFGTRFQALASLPPIELGYGFPLNAKDRNQKKKFFLSIGGRF